jgi:hypothetical protein
MLAAAPHSLEKSAGQVFMKYLWFRAIFINKCLDNMKRTP